MKLHHIAKVCHQANKAYCESIGDFTQFDWELASDWQKESSINGVMKMVQSGGTLHPSDLHESWMKEKVDGGWKYGPEKDAVKKTHPCIVKYEHLPETQKAKDFLFGAICLSFSQFGIE